MVDAVLSPTSEILGTKGLQVLIATYRGNCDETLGRLTMRYNLTTWYKFVNKEKNTAICLKALDKQRIQKIIKRGPKFLNKNHILKYGRSYLECYSVIAGKKWMAKPKGIVPGIDALGAISKAHANFIQKLGHKLSDPNPQCGNGTIKMVTATRKEQ